MTRLWLAASLCLASAACAGKHHPRTHLEPRSEARPVEGWQFAEDNLSTTMRAFAPELERAGVKAETRAFRGFLSSSGRATHRVELPAQTCATLLAIASPGVHDMDAALYSPQGELLAADARPDAHPAIQLCTGDQPAEFYYALHVYEGAGSFLMVPFLGTKHSLEAVSKRLGAPPAIAHLDHGGVDPIDRVTAFAAGVRRRGFEAHQSPLRIPLAAKQPVRVGLPVEPGECYTAAGFALEGVGDVNLRVLDDEGGEVARDEAPGDSALQFCAERAAQYAAEIRGTTGPGAALLTLFRADGALLGGTDALWLGERPAAKASQTPLSEALAGAARRAAADGFKRRQAFGTQRLLPGEAVRKPIALPARSCTRIHAVGGPGLRELRLTAADASGAELDSAQGGVQSTYLHICTASPQVVHLALHASAGSGDVTLVGFDAPLAKASLAGAGEQLSARYHQAAAQARDAGYRPHPAFARGPRRLAVAAGQPRPLAFEAPSARCVRALLLSSDGSVKAKLLRDGKPLVSTRANSASAHACGEGEAPLGHVDLALQAEQAQTDAWLMLLIK